MTNIAYVDNLLLLATDTPGDFVGIGTTMPQGKFHVDDTTGSLLFCSKSGIVGSAVTIIANGAGDITKRLQIVGIVTNSIPQTYSVNSGQIPGGNIEVSDGGAANILRFTIGADGSVTVARTVGTATWSISVLIIWQ